MDAPLASMPEALGIQPQSQVSPLASLLMQSGGSPASQPSNFDIATESLGLNPQEQALYQRHLTNLNGPGGVDNPDGSRSTLFQTTLPHNGKFYNVPTVWDGKIEADMSPEGKFQGLNQTAMQNIQKTGIENFPSYPSEDAAEARYMQMHDFMDRDTGAYMRSRGR